MSAFFFLLLLMPSLQAQSWDWGGSVRAYSFFRLEDTPFTPPDQRRDSQFGSFRLTFQGRFGPRVKLESHAVLDILSPPASSASGVVFGQTRSYLPLQTDLVDEEDALISGRFDRLNLKVDFDDFRVELGRQAITWGVTYFWPALDLFSTFAPQRVDREYKEGVDAVRVTVPVGSYSEVQVVGAVLGRSLSDDGAAAALARLHLGPLDLGLMGGKFHRDTVAGTFLTFGYRGSSYRTEVSWTLSGDPRDRTLGRRTFWRGAFGIDRQLSPDWGLTVEMSYNGFGAEDAAGYLTLAQADRVARGEVAALGRWYSGAALNWQLHPLWTFSNSVLVNWQDPSALWIPTLEWSTSNNSSVLFAAQVGNGSEKLDTTGVKSEYGLVPATLFAAIRWYF